MAKCMAMERLSYQMLIFWLMLDSSLCHNCTGQLTCGDCIRQAGCTWCSDENFPTAPRCQPFLLQNFCPLSSIVRSQSSVVEIIPATTASSLNISRVSLNLTVGDPLTFKVAVTPQQNPAVDVYILTDSFDNALIVLRAIASDIAQRLLTITPNVRLGLGAFRDKRNSPHQQTFIDRDVPFLNNSRYAFRHYVSLTNKFSEFADALQTLPEGTSTEREQNGLDALAQVITCEDIIGWQSQARIVIMVTTSVQHIAGEGRISGILTPYNGTCLLEQTNMHEPVEYSSSEEIDFPSFGQIQELLRDFGVVAVFATATPVMSHYEAIFSSVFNGSSIWAVVAEFEYPVFSRLVTEREILDIIESQTLRFIQTVSLDTSGIPSFLSFEITAFCPTKSIQGGAACDRVPLGSTVDFSIVATLNTCEGLLGAQVLNFSISSPAHGTFDLSITVTCDCECARSRERNPDDCSGVGVRSCGVCDCDRDQCGSNCEVTRNGTSSNNCLSGENNLKCSGRGICDCNFCFCDTFGDPGLLVYGDACECDNFRCPSTGPLELMEVCSGLDRGMCCNSRCMCLNSSRGNPYRGDGQVNNCQCEPVEEVCIDPQNRRMCNGRGTCGCNSCICDDPIQYSGVFCEILNVHTCGFEGDVECIKKCSAAISEASLPSVCSEMCVGNRPIVIIEEKTSLETIISLLGNDIGEFTTLRGPCKRQNQPEYYILNNGSHFFIAALIRHISIDRTFTSVAAASVPSIIELLIICVMIALGIWLFIKKKKKGMKFWKKRKGSQNSILPSLTHVREKKTTLLPGHCIQLQDTIGQGGFGVVHKGHLHGWQHRSSELVAIKILRRISGSDHDCLINDSAKLMRMDHIHVLSLIGICTELGEAPYIVLPYMANGSLLHYLQEERFNLMIDSDATTEMISDATREFLSMCLQIALGMSYLSELGVAHGLLGARNCMINEDFVIKVADFGLSFLLKKDLRKKSEGLPIQWMAPESIRHSVFTEKSDVWSFGVTCWEVFSLGDAPYSGMGYAQYMEFLKDGLRLLKPKHPACSNSVYKEIMSNCWTDKPNKRPTFEMITRRLDVLVEGVTRY